MDLNALKPYPQVNSSFYRSIIAKVKKKKKKTISNWREVCDSLLSMLSLHILSSSPFSAISHFLLYFLLLFVILSPHERFAFALLRTLNSPPLSLTLPYISLFYLPSSKEKTRHSSLSPCLFLPFLLLYLCLF